jgi:hypothetical protein
MRELEVKTAGLEIDGEAEVMEVTKATRNALSHLEEPLVASMAAFVRRVSR